VLNPLEARDDKCDKGSWLADAGKEKYTKPSSSTQVVYASGSGPADITITKTREQSWSTRHRARCAEMKK
jgi:hypothetical protein